MSERLPDPDPSRFPDQPARFLRRVGAGALLGRVHWTEGDYPSQWGTYRTWGPVTTARFDPHPEPAGEHPHHRVLYAAVKHDVPDRTQVPLLDACLSECFQDTGTINYSRNAPYFTLFRTTQELRLLDVTDTDWVDLAGGNAALTAGSRKQSRTWARAIFATYPLVQGIWYGPSSNPAARAAALWRRSASALPERPIDSRPLADPALRADLEVYTNQREMQLEP